MAKRKQNKPKEKRLSLKEKYQILEQAGYSPKESRLYRNRSEENVMKLINQKRKSSKKETFKPKTFLKEFKRILEGTTETREAVEKVYKEKSVISQRKPRKGKTLAGGQKVLILWKDVTENVGREYMDDILEGYQGESLEQLIDSARGWRDMVFGEIGTWVVSVISDSDLYQTLKMYPEYEKVYFGNGTQYKKLIEKLNFMMLAIYQSVKKDLFIREVIDAFLYVNPPVAQRLATDFEIGY